MSRSTAVGRCFYFALNIESEAVLLLKVKNSLNSEIAILIAITLLLAKLFSLLAIADTP